MALGILVTLRRCSFLETSSMRYMGPRDRKSTVDNLAVDVPVEEVGSTFPAAFFCQITSGTSLSWFARVKLAVTLLDPVVGVEGTTRPVDVGNSSWLCCILLEIFMNVLISGRSTSTSSSDTTSI